MTHTFVLDEGVVISAHAGIDPNTNSESDEAYVLLGCIGRNRHKLVWTDEAWDRYHRQIRGYDGPRRPVHVLRLLLDLAADPQTFHLVFDDELQPLERPADLPEDDRLWVQMMLASAGELVTTDRRLQRSVRDSPHYAHLGKRVHLVPEALPFACSGA